MKPRIFLLKQLSAAWLVAAVVQLPALNAAPPAATAAPAKSELMQSVFIMPVNPKEGRDPFFPNSIRVYRDTPVKSQDGGGIAIGSMKLKGISGSGTNLIATINNHNFAVGEEGEINTSQGRVHLRCIGINPQTRSATIQVRSGQMAELFLPGPQ
jgi:hypothetical protein